MAIEDIIQEIEKEKQEKIQELKKEKEKQVLALKKNYEKEIEKKEEEILSDAKEELKKKILKTEEELKRKKDILILQEKKKLLEKVQGLAFEEIKEFAEKSKKEILENFLKKAFLEVKEISDSEIEIIPACRGEKILEEVLKNLQKKYKISSNCLNSVGGFVLKTKKFELNYSFESIFEKIKDETEMKIVKILFS